MLSPINKPSLPLNLYQLLSVICQIWWITPYYRLLIGRGKKVKFCGIFRDWLAEIFSSEVLWTSDSLWASLSTRVTARHGNSLWTSVISHNILATDLFVIINCNHNNIYVRSWHWHRNRQLGIKPSNCSFFGSGFGLQMMDIRHWNCYYSKFRCHKIQYSQIYINIKGNLQLSLQLSHI